MKDDSKDTSRKKSEDPFECAKKKKGWVRRLLDWTAEGNRKALKSGNYCPT